MASTSELFERAVESRRHAYAPYSRFAVGAALLAEDGRIFTGVNVENASYGATICAERSALAAAVGAGARSFRAIAIAGPSGTRTTPCGVCRQALAEFGPLTVAFADERGALTEVPLAELLPDAFRLPAGVRHRRLDSDHR